MSQIDLEDRVRRSVERHVHDVVPPKLDLGDLQARARRRHRVRALGATAGSAALAVAVVMVATVLVDTGATPRRPSAETSPDGSVAISRPQSRAGARGPARVDAPRQVFVSAEAVWVDGRRHEVTMPFDGAGTSDLDGPDPVFTEATSSSVHLARDGVVFPGGGNRPMLLERDGSVGPMAPARPTLAGAVYDDWVAADPASPLVAWDEYDGRTVRVVAYDTAARRVVATRDLTCDDSFASGCQRPYVVSDGIVFISGRQDLAWDPLTGVTTDVRGSVQQARNRVVQPEQGTRPDLSGLPGGWTVVREPGGAEYNLSFDGGWLLDNSGEESLVVNWRDPEQVIRYDLPRDATEAVFDTDGSVLVVTASAGRFTGWDCALATGCQVVVPAQRGELRLVGWDT